MKLWKFLIVLGIVGAVAAVLVAGINFLVLPSLVHSNEEVAVPDLRGASPQAAADLLRPLDLEVVVLRTSAHANMGAGLISDQVPAPDAAFARGAWSRWWSAAGRRRQALPTWWASRNDRRALPCSATVSSWAASRGCRRKA